MQGTRALRRRELRVQGRGIDSAPEEDGLEVVGEEIKGPRERRRPLQQERVAGGEEKREVERGHGDLPTWRGAAGRHVLTVVPHGRWWGGGHPH